jgi:aminomuconate-semialdehyde/2-hydroxymuconate-6-semialdehyde dehydrogenase
MTWKVGPALACGNTVVVKPSEETPRTAALLGEVMEAVGMPKGVYNVVHGFGPDSAGEFLTSHKDVDAITFTGETGTGTAIMKQAALGIRDISFELGGKNPAVVFDKFVERFAEAARAFRPGDLSHPQYMGPLISEEHRSKVLGYYQRAVDEGATVVTGGGVPKNVDGGFYVEPTIWTGLKPDSTVMREEVFGPCCGVIPFDTEEEAIALANDTPYGLSATVWTQDLARAHRVSGEMEVGICWVNCWFLRDLRTAFGGAGQSGIGREGGVHSLEFYTELANICVKL